MPFAPAATISPSRRDRDRAQAASAASRSSARDAVERPDAQRQIVRRAHHRLAVRRERDAVDVLRVALEHARRCRRASGQSRTVLSHAAEASVAPSRRNRERHDRRGVPFAAPCRAAACPRSRSRCARPRRPSRRGRRAAARPRSRHRRGSAAPARRHCASSDQRIAEVSKLPEIAVAPSADTATARTGPPCPRNCACVRRARNQRQYDERNTPHAITRPPRPGAASAQNPRSRSPRPRRRRGDRPECRRYTA